MTWREWADDQADEVRAAGRWRAPRDLDASGPEGKLAPDGAPVVSFASNDYLGLTQHPSVVAAAHAALDRWGAGSGSARLIVGSRPVHSELEHALAEWKRAERAVLFPTGFAANLGVLTTFGGPDVVVVSDELNHASIIDGCRLARAESVVARHADAEHVEALLVAAAPRRGLVVTDTVFSMDGDLAPVDDLLDVCARHRALLVLDEAHAVLGPDPDVGDAEVVRIGTLSKTLGALGGFAAATAPFVELLENRARSYIFTTASTPADTAAALAALAVLRSADGARLVSRLRAHVDRVRQSHPSPIVPVVLGDERVTLSAAAALLEQGMLVPAIRPPTVPVGTSRLRVTLSAAHTVEQVDALVAALAAITSTGRLTAAADTAAAAVRLTSTGRLTAAADTAAAAVRLTSTGRLTAAADTAAAAVRLTGAVTRPHRLVVVTGTGTEVGKTWVAARLAAELTAHGQIVAARKPVQSFALGDAETDAHVLAVATADDPRTVCTPDRWYEVALAPPMAAEALGRPAFTIADLATELAWPDSVDVGLVEGAGGPRSPLASDGDTVDLARELDADAIVLVADAGLGTINAVRLAHPPLADIARVIVVLNRYDATDDLHARNLEWLTVRAGFDVTVTTEELAHHVMRLPFGSLTARRGYPASPPFAP